MIKIKAQAWSMDIALAVIIFIAAFFIIYILVTSRTTSNIPLLQQEAERISKEAILQNSSLSIINNEIINETKIQELLEKYPELKGKIRVENEFCIYFEDDEGNLILIKDASGGDIAGVGSPNITISGTPCR